MPLLKEEIYTIEDIYALPEGERAELIDGQIYMMAAPSARHQRLSMDIGTDINRFIRDRKGDCRVFAAPFAVFLSEDSEYVEPDLSVICDPSKIDDRGCHGAPDWVIEIVSPTSRSMDYMIKMTKYQTEGVREYWIVDPEKDRVMVCSFEKEEFTEYTLRDEIPAGIYEGELRIRIGE